MTNEEKIAAYNKMMKEQAEKAEEEFIQKVRNSFIWYEYICEYWDEEDSKRKTRFGVVYAPSLSDAMAEIGKWYGEEYIWKLVLNIAEFKDEDLVYEFGSLSETFKFKPHGVKTSFDFIDEMEKHKE